MCSLTCKVHPVEAWKQVGGTAIHYNAAIVYISAVPAVLIWCEHMAWGNLQQDGYQCYWDPLPVALKTEGHGQNVTQFCRDLQRHGCWCHLWARRMSGFQSRARHTER